jgi:DNA-binding CsgD family transcriptional regulator
MTEQLEIWTQYNETGGYVDRPASRDRAYAEIADGSFSQRQQDIYQLLREAGSDGMTWKQIGDILGLHHGKVSGALSNMHSGGMIFMLKQRRDKCHPYVHSLYRGSYAAEDRYDSPARTKSNARNDLLEVLLGACRNAVDEAFMSTLCIDKIIEAVVMIDAHDRKPEAKSRVRGQS